MNVASRRAAALLLGLVAIVTLLPGVIVSFAPGAPSPTACSLRAPDGSYQDRLPPSTEHWFGTDRQGCDQFSRVVHGARHSVVVGGGAALGIALVGGLLGVLAGWRGGWVDSLVRRTGDVTLGIPFVVGAILLLSVLVEGERSAGIVIAVLIGLVWPTTARIARASTRSIRHLPYVEAARASGASDLRICVRHVVPNALPAVGAFTASLVGLLIGAEASLAYLGVGVGGNVVSWGRMLDDGQAYYGSSPHLVIFPGLFLSITVAGFLLLGDAISAGTATAKASR